MKEITILIKENDTMEEQIIEAEDIQISIISLKFNAINVRIMVTIKKIVTLIFNIITAKSLVIINMSVGLKTQKIKKMHAKFIETNKDALKL
jgi:hypothetical protein